MRETHLNTELENEIATEVMHVSRRLIQRGARVIEKLNIGVGQVPILKLLSDNGTMTQRQIAEETRVTPATICCTLNRMEMSGLVQRAVGEEDGRVSCVSLTDEGRARCEQALAALRLPYGEILEGFSEAECRQLLDFVRRMGGNLTRTDEEQSE